MIMFLDLLIIAAGFGIFIVLLTQVLLPGMFGTPFFPWFNQSAVKDETKKLEHMLEGLSELEQFNVLVAEVKRRQAEMDKSK